MNRLVVTGLLGSASAAVCCFTPLFAGVLGIVGLGWIVGYLDYVLIPALTGFIGLMFYGLLKKNRSRETEGKI